MPIKAVKKKTGATPPGTLGGDNKKQVIIAAANKYKISPNTLWGVSGAESNFGQNHNNSGVGPSGGAKGPFQFEDGTAARYGLNSQTVHDWTHAAFAAAHYLHDLGANSDPNSGKTKAAVVGYNTGRVGDFAGAASGYLDSVLKLGATFDGSGTGAGIQDPTGQGGASGGTSPVSGGGVSALDVLSQFLSGDIEALGAELALVSVGIIKNVAIGAVDLILAPAWHWNQRTVMYYNQTVLNPKNALDDTSEYRYAFLWTAVFWGFGYAILWPDEGHLLKATEAHRARLARYVRRAQAQPAKRSLVKPKDVKDKTAKKPKEETSRAPVSLVDTMTTTRRRPVHVQGRENAGGEPVTTTTPVKETGTANPEASATPKPHPDNHSREGTPRNRREDSPQGSGESGRGGGNS